MGPPVWRGERPVMSGDGILVVDVFSGQLCISDSKHIMLALTWTRLAVGDARSDFLAGQVKQSEDFTENLLLYE